MPKFFRAAVSCRERMPLLVLIAAGCLAASAAAQSSSQRLFMRMSANFAADDSLRRTLAYSYDLHLTGTFYLKADSVQIMEDWRIIQTPDSIRARPISRQTSGKAETAKQYVPPVRLASVKRGMDRTADDPLMAAIGEMLHRIKKDAKAQVMIDGETAGRDGAKNHVLRFLADGRTGSLRINAATAKLERLEWAYGKSIGLSSSGEKSAVELAPVWNGMFFPIKLVFNGRARTLLRRAGSYTEIEIKNFKREERP